MKDHEKEIKMKLLEQLMEEMDEANSSRLHKPETVEVSRLESKEMPIEELPESIADLVKEEVELEDEEDDVVEEMVEDIEEEDVLELEEAFEEDVYEDDEILEDEEEDEDAWMDEDENSVVARLRKLKRMKDSE
jgi:hypothetical protein